MMDIMTFSIENKEVKINAEMAAFPFMHINMEKNLGRIYLRKLALQEEEGCMAFANSLFLLIVPCIEF